MFFFMCLYFHNICYFNTLTLKIQNNIFRFKLREFHITIRFLRFSAELGDFCECYYDFSVFIKIKNSMKGFSDLIYC